MVALALLRRFVENIRNHNMAFKMKGVKHFTKDKNVWTGGTHKMDDGSLHTGKTHNENSEKLFHEGDSALKKKVSWKYGKGTYSGELIPSKETSTHRYARTHNGKVKSLPK